MHAGEILTLAAHFFRPTSMNRIEQKSRIHSGNIHDSIRFLYNFIHLHIFEMSAFVSEGVMSVAHGWVFPLITVDILNRIIWHLM